MSPPKPPEIVGRQRLERDAVELAAALDWLDERAGWKPGTSRSKVRARLDALDLGTLLDWGARRARVGRTALARALVEYYGDQGIYRAICADAEILTSVVGRAEWLDLACPLGGVRGELTLAEETGDRRTLDEVEASAALSRLAESVALGVRFANLPLYRLRSVDVGPGRVRGRVGIAPFVEYALTADLLERELIDAVAAGSTARELPCGTGDCRVSMRCTTYPVAYVPVAFWLCARSLGRMIKSAVRRITPCWCRSGLVRC